MRLIDADALIDDIKNHLWDWETVNGITAQTVLKQTITDVENQPTISPWHRVEEPPKTHMWCFVYTDEPDMIMPIRIAFYTASCTGKGSWYHYESGSDITDEVDYWTEMNLEGPKLDHDLPWPIEPPKEDA